AWRASRARCSPACYSPNTAGTRPIWRAPPSSRSRSAWPCASYRSVRGPAVAEEDQGRRAVFAPLALLEAFRRREVRAPGWPLDHDERARRQPAGGGQRRERRLREIAVIGRVEKDQ